MKNIVLLLAAASLFACSHGKYPQKNKTASIPSLPAAISGSFMDDYGSSYIINDTALIQRPGNTYQLISCDTVARVIIARNSMDNKSEQGLYTRIDYMFFDEMAPWTWGYCLTVYNAPDDSAARAAVAADRSNPRKGCNGFPFTRMKRP